MKKLIFAVIVSTITPIAYANSHQTLFSGTFSWYGMGIEPPFGTNAINELAPEPGNANRGLEPSSVDYTIEIWSDASSESLVFSSATITLDGTYTTVGTALPGFEWMEFTTTFVDSTYDLLSGDFVGVTSAPPPIFTLEGAVNGGATSFDVSDYQGNSTLSGGAGTTTTTFFGFNLVAVSYEVLLDFTLGSSVGACEKASSGSNNICNPEAAVVFQTNSGSAAFKMATEGYAPVPVPAAIWLFGSALIGLVGVDRKRRVA